MEINRAKFERVIKEAKAKAAGNARWIAAIDKGADAIINGKWVVTQLFYCWVFTTESGKTYRANGVCQCEAFFRDQPCKHRAAARLLDLYNETPDDDRASLIAGIKATWPRVSPHLPLETELMARFGKNRLEMLDDDMLRRVSLAIAL